jgi:hypothetical protein
VGRQAAVPFQQWIVNQRLKEDCPAAGAQHADDLEDRGVKFQVVKNPFAKDCIEGRISEWKLFRCTLQEIHSRATTAAEQMCSGFGQASL